MNKIRMAVEKLGTGTIIIMIIFLSMAVALMASNGINFFPFINNPQVRKTLMLSLVYFLWAVAGIVVLVRRVEGFPGPIISFIAILFTIAALLLALYPIYSLIFNK